jgi:ribonuclease R
MVGSRSGETYRLGDPVTVKLVEAAPVAGALRFELLSSGRLDIKQRQTHRGRGRDDRGRNEHRRHRRKAR